MKEVFSDNFYSSSQNEKKNINQTNRQKNDSSGQQPFKNCPGTHLSMRVKQSVEKLRIKCDILKGNIFLGESLSYV